jgi:hypothetical protein
MGWLAQPIRVIVYIEAASRSDPIEAASPPLKRSDPIEAASPPP